MRSEKHHTISLTVILVGLAFVARLFALQVVGGSYQLAAEKNILQRIVVWPHRGEIRDRQGNLLTYNEPLYDLMGVPSQIKYLNPKAFCAAFRITPEEFATALARAKKYSFVKPSVFIKGLRQEQFAAIQDHLSEYPGFSVRVYSVRHHTYPILSNSLGYLAEVDMQRLTTDDEHYYAQGDVIGMNGLEKYYETVLRGTKGIHYTLSDVRGVEQGRFEEGKLDLPPVPGSTLTTTIDRALQAYGEKLLEGKIGSIVAIEPATGEILALVSSPSYDPNLLTGQGLSKNFGALQMAPNNPLFNRAVMAMYPPGSIFKLIQALIALQEGVITPTTTYVCDRSLLKCRNHSSPVSLQAAIQYSCNPYFYHVFRKIINQHRASDVYEDTRIGLQRWHGYVSQFGLGSPLGIDLPHEKGGYIPEASYYDRRYGRSRWKASTIRSLDIGQGEILVTPLQMANFMVAIANKGFYYTPHLAKAISGKPVLLQAVGKHTIAIATQHFEVVADAMDEAVQQGMAWRAYIPGLPMCCKTGTVQNPHGEDHSVFVAFAPKDNPRIALSVYVENGGWGSRAAAAIGGLMIEQYLAGEIRRLAIEQYVLTGNFLH